MVARLQERWWAAAPLPPRIVPGVSCSSGLGAGSSGSERLRRDRLAGASCQSLLSTIEVTALVSRFVLADPALLRGESSLAGADSGQVSPAAPPPVASTAEVTAF